eukprot:13451180-Alexandrium_andersonii.AAC.1
MQGLRSQVERCHAPFAQRRRSSTGSHEGHLRSLHVLHLLGHPVHLRLQLPVLAAVFVRAARARAA